MDGGCQLKTPPREDCKVLSKQLTTSKCNAGNCGKGNVSRIASPDLYIGCITAQYDSVPKGLMFPF